ncbi:triosephosphate isomerase [Loktanella salsilacus]|uniref:Triosephosphate isomerase n=2 Tax=Loktanella salsilacus TaxID=195913 RepID=A0A1I4BSL3_9RHOB|nr:triose-phosphate isomerase [Loktanella salsilacus]MBU0779811.1 triose-phosphate isomerase [Alphaproteobacteria bacterium]MBU1837390.1 triose-phosphate isomerase [Alphaproteobacteria bacterium]SFK71197.1 triosephosphate isomerase [Loktanella salsilacus]
MRRKLAAGNWKMNGTTDTLREVKALTDAHPDPLVDMLLCPPATLLAQMAWARGTHALQIGGQDCHAAATGAHTGDIAADMLKDAGASHVIVGHSERRSEHGETDADVAAKAAAAHTAGLIAVICLGETLAQREAGEALAVVTAQLAGSVPAGATAANTVIAYEPVWAIGTGHVPTLDQIGEVHGTLRAALRDIMREAGGVRILYGGSVKGSNAAEIFSVPDVDGALVGGASLTAADFSPIVTALENA